MVYKFARNGKIFLESESKDVAAHQDSGVIVATDHYWTSGMSGWLLVGLKNDWEPVLPPPISVAPRQAVRTLIGKVIGFNVSESKGFILGDDGARYVFNGIDWRNDAKLPCQGLEVRFEAKGGEAFVIYPTSLPSSSVTPNSSKSRPFAYSAWMVAAFFAPYIFSWRIIFDKTLGYSKGWKIFYALWIPIVLVMTSGGGRSSSGRTESLESKNAAFMSRLTPEQRIAVETMQRNLRIALRENFDYQDNDKDGRLDMKEFLSQGILKNTYGPSDFERFDINKDGYVTFEEQMQK